MKDERTRTITLVIAFAVGAASLFFTDTPAQLGYGVTAACSIGAFIFGTVIYLVARRQFLAKRATDAAQGKKQL